MDQERDYCRRRQVSNDRSRPRVDLSESAESAEIRRTEHGPDVLGESHHVGHRSGLLSPAGRLRSADDGRGDEDSGLLRLDLEAETVGRTKTEERKEPDTEEKAGGPP